MANVAPMRVPGWSFPHECGEGLHERHTHAALPLDRSMNCAPTLLPPAVPQFRQAAAHADPSVMALKFPQAMANDVGFQPARCCAGREGAAGA